MKVHIWNSFTDYQVGLPCVELGIAEIDKSNVGGWFLKLDQNRTLLLPSSVVIEVVEEE